jgi:hypothetical protein
VTVRFDAVLGTQARSSEHVAACKRRRLSSNAGACARSQHFACRTSNHTGVHCARVEWRTRLCVVVCRTAQARAVGAATGVVTVTTHNANRTQLIASGLMRAKRRRVLEIDTRFSERSFDCTFNFLRTLRGTCTGTEVNASFSPHVVVVTHD